MTFNHLYEFIKNYFEEFVIYYYKPVGQNFSCKTIYERQPLNSINELPFAEKFFSENLTRNELNEILSDLIEILLKSNYINNKFDSNFHKEDFLNMLILIYYIAREYKEYYIEKDLQILLQMFFHYFVYRIIPENQRNIFIGLVNNFFKKGIMGIEYTKDLNKTSSLSIEEFSNNNTNKKRESIQIKKEVKNTSKIIKKRKIFI